MEISFKSKFSVFSICFLCNVVRHADIVAWSIIRPQFKEDLKFTSFVLGVIDMMFLFSYAIGNIISGSLGDSYDSKKVLCLGMMGSGVSQCFVLNI
jgi:sugar phosphate permease